MAIRFCNYDIKFDLKNKRKVVSWIKEIVKNNNKSIGEISIIFTSDKNIIEVNNQYLNHNYYTDIITFDYSFKNIIEGDIYISVETVFSNSVEFHTEYCDEILRVIIHGVLHLLGFKDKKAYDRAEMRRQEDLALKLFNKLE